MKKLILLSGFLAAFIITNAQIGGLSASKGATLTAYTVGKHTIEFEPSFGISYVNGEYLDNGTWYKYDSTFFDNGFGFRFSYGVSNRIESGISLPVDVSEISWGTKVFILDKDVFKLSGIFGAGFDFSSPQFLSNAGIGMVTTFQFTDNFSTDFDIHALKDFKNPNDFQIALGFDNGLYVGDIQYLVGMNYFKTNKTQQLLITPGITIEPANNFLIVLTVPFTVYGKNQTGQIGFGFALTTTLE